jgi:Tfp pilus assembly protein PilX
MSRSYDNRRRRQGIYLFIVVYVAFLLTVIALEMVRNHQFGQGFF